MAAAPEQASPGLLDNLSIFGGLDGSKDPQDLGINANFGVRSAINWSYPLLAQYGLGIQAGTALNYSHNAVAILETVDGTHDRTQSFTTVGLFQRTECGLVWGFAYDFLFEDYYQNVDLGQWRGRVGYAFGNEEVGLWGATGDHGDSAAVGSAAFRLEPITQGSLYWQHLWGNDTITRFWGGVAEEHGRFILVMPGRPPVHHPVLFGAEIQVPLNRWLAIFGEANFITPNDTGTVDASLGFVISFGGVAQHSAANRFAPLLQVANNPTFAVDLKP
jgi:hypothetical protein